MVKQLNLAVGQIYDVNIIDYTSDGGGIAKIANFPLFVPDVLKGEQVSITITKLNKGYGFAKLNKIIEASSERKPAKCPIYDECGGCQLQHMSSNEEREFKLAKVANNFHKIAHIDFDNIMYEEFSEWDYRNKLIVPVQKVGNKVILGFFKQKTHEIIPFPDMKCVIQNPQMMLTLQQISTIIADSQIKCYDEKARRGNLRNIYIRANENGQQIVTLVVREVDYHVKELGKKIIDLANVIGVMTNINKTVNNNLFGQKWHNLAGETYLPVTINNVYYRVHPASFLQVNHQGMNSMYDYVTKMAEKFTKHGIIDLYCGSGTITLQLAKECAKPVFGVEIVEEAIMDAKINAKANYIKDVEFITGDSTQAFAQIQQSKQVYDTLVVDPPRKGLTSELCLEINQTASINNIIYVSCDSGTLARDLAIFHEKGWQITATKLFNLFPQTNHVESVVTLERKHDEVI